MSLFRTLFWAGVLVLVLALAPDFGMLGPASERGREKAGVQDLVYIVSETASDLGGICKRRPEVCRKLDRIWQQFCNRAVYLTSAAHDWLTGQDLTEAIPADVDDPARARTGPPPERPGSDGWNVAETPPEHRQ